MSSGHRASIPGPRTGRVGAQDEPEPSPGRAAQAVVEVSLPATVHWLSAVRAVATEVALRADFELDSIEDLKVAVDEAASRLITASLPDRPLCGRFEVTETDLLVAVSATSAEPLPSPEGTFGWHVLNVVVDQASVEDEIDESEGLHRPAIRLRKQRSRWV